MAAAGAVGPSPCFPEKHIFCYTYNAQVSNNFYQTLFVEYSSNANCLHRSFGKLSGYSALY